jgi:predicted TIM-barrel fold metal-dependent hydrolase
MKTDFEIIDAHIHPFVNEKSNIKWFDSPNSVEDFFSELQRAGISKSCGSVIRKLENPVFSDIRSLNEEAIELQSRYPDSYIAGINVHGSFPNESCEEVERLDRKGKIHWIGELVAYMMDYENYASENMFQIYALAQDLKLPVNIHPNNFDEIEKVCKNFPDLNVIIAHLGSGKQNAEERFSLLKKYSNLYLDLSGSGVFRYGVLRRGINEAGKHKFLFGSDYPICNPYMMIHGILFEHLADDELEAVFSRNFKRLAKI